MKIEVSAKYCENFRWGLLSAYRQEHNERFAVAPNIDVDVHQQLFKSEEELKILFSRQEQRKVTKNLEVSYNNNIYQLTEVSKGRRLMHASITVCEAESGDVHLMYQSKILSYKKFTKHNRPNRSLSRQEINMLLDKKRVKRIPSATHPWRNYSKKNNVESIGDVR